MHTACCSRSCLNAVQYYGGAFQVIDLFHDSNQADLSLCLIFSSLLSDSLKYLTHISG